MRPFAAVAAVCNVEGSGAEGRVRRLRVAAALEAVLRAAVFLLAAFLAEVFLADVFRALPFGAVFFAFFAGDRLDAFRAAFFATRNLRSQETRV
jgi:hypothetical protein